MSFRDFCRSFGLDSFPFNTYTTEQELEYARELFIAQGEYDPIMEAFAAGRSIIITGERGSGKTAILEDFKRSIEGKKKVYTIISDFSELKARPKTEEIYRLILTNILIELFPRLKTNVRKAARLTKAEKVLLSYLLYKYLPGYSLKSLKEKIEELQVPPVQRALRDVYNKVRGPLNVGVTVGKNILHEYLQKQLAFLPALENEQTVYEYFPELKGGIDVTFFDQKISYALIAKTAGIFTKMGLGKPVIFIDKIDEDKRFQNNGEKIAEFLKPFLIDNQLLGSPHLQTVFFVWSTPFRYIREYVRTQKYYCPSLEWTREDLKKLVNRRLAYFSHGALKDFRALFDGTVTGEQIDGVFRLANDNPRDILHIFETLFKEQYARDPASGKIRGEIIDNALTAYVTGFNYYEYYPRKLNARADTMDIYSFAAHLLKLEKPEFTKNQLNEKAKIGGSLHNYITGMERIGLIENVHKKQKGTIVYRIKDPKIVYALENHLEIKK